MLQCWRTLQADDVWGVAQLLLELHVPHSLQPWKVVGQPSLPSPVHCPSPSPHPSPAACGTAWQVPLPTTPLSPSPVQRQPCIQCSPHPSPAACGTGGAAGGAARGSSWRGWCSSQSAVTKPEGDVWAALRVLCTAALCRQARQRHRSLGPSASLKLPLHPHSEPQQPMTGWTI